MSQLATRLPWFICLNIRKDKLTFFIEMRRRARQSLTSNWSLSKSGAQWEWMNEWKRRDTFFSVWSSRFCSSSSSWQSICAKERAGRVRKKKLEWKDLKWMMTSSFASLQLDLFSLESKRKEIGCSLVIIIIIIIGKCQRQVRRWNSRFDWKRRCDRMVKGEIKRCVG